ncbi:hypothetical protein EK21DRAFT_109011 [Setomelanomma holmii]|uniref:Uncharacterized protein n=1 Tax=Setomelanomma holmii TaxID=210430 RepID=A0A9P4LPV8_9PLEO|nr:hypothetical protein EK21DRAFT_109011 [Setomelanomma holmii]
MEHGKAEKYQQKFTLLGLSSSLLLDNAVSVYWRSLRLELVTMIYALHSILSIKDNIPELKLPESDDFEVDVAKEALFGVDNSGGARAHQNKPLEHRLARAMLSSAGFLDISKMVEYRIPQFPSQCGDPQLGVLKNQVVHLKKGRMDVQFLFLTCNDCGKVFRAPYYECTLGCRHVDFDETGEDFAVCATCFRTTTHEQAHLRRKRLQSDISESVARELCTCPEVDNPLHVSLVLEGIKGKDIDAWFEERQKSGLTLEGHVRTCQYLAMQAKRRACVESVNGLEDKAQIKKLGKEDGKYEPRFGDRIQAAFKSHAREALSDG